MFVQIGTVNQNSSNKFSGHTHLFSSNNRLSYENVFYNNDIYKSNYDHINSYKLYKCLGHVNVTQIISVYDSISVDSNYSKYLQSINNKNCHSLYGNKRNIYNTKLLHVNKGSSYFHNCVNQMSDIFQNHNPDIACISEANVQIDNMSFMNVFSKYNIEVSLMSNKTQLSRNIILIDKKIKYKRRYDLENDITSTIWIEVYKSKNKTFLLMGGYRQWQLPSCLSNENTNLPSKLFDRYKLIIDSWNRAIMEGKETIVLMDANIDTSTNSCHNSQYSIKKLHDLLLSHMNDHNICQHNKELTHFNGYHQPSLIDHIYSNCPLKISNVTTSQNIYSDHSIITAIYSSKEQLSHPRFLNIRNWKLLTKEKLCDLIDRSELLNSIFKYTDPNIIENIIQIELNSIIDFISPSKTVQF